MADLELRQLRYLIAIAETGSITRAAQRLLMTQPALSRAVRALERTVGVDLLVRGARATELTPAGSALLVEAYELVERSDAALARARGTRPGIRTLTVTAHECDVVAAVAASRAFEAEHTGVRVQVRARTWDSRPQPDELRAGEADVSFLRDCFDRHDLVVEPLAQEPRLVVFPAGHPLANRAGLTVSDLRDEPITYWAGMSPQEGAHWSGGDADRYPRRHGPRVRTAADALAAVLLGQAIAFGHDTTLRQATIPGLRIRPVEGLTPSRLEIAIPARGRNPAAELFTDFARRRWSSDGR